MTRKVKSHRQRIPTPVIEVKKGSPAQPELDLEVELKIESVEPVNDLVKRLNEIEELLNRTKARHQQTTQEHADLAKRLELILKEKDELQEERNSLLRQVEDKIEENNDLKEETSRLSAELEVMRQREDKLILFEEEREQLLKKNDALVEENRELVLNVARLEQHKKNLEQEKEQLEKSPASVKSFENDLTEAVKKLELDFKMAVNEKERLQKLLDETRIQIEARQTTFPALERQVQDLSAQLQALQAAGNSGLEQHYQPARRQMLTVSILPALYEKRLTQEFTLIRACAEPERLAALQRLESTCEFITFHEQELQELQKERCVHGHTLSN